MHEQAVGDDEIERFVQYGGIFQRGVELTGGTAENQIQLVFQQTVEHLRRRRAGGAQRYVRKERLIALEQAGKENSKTSLRDADAHLARGAVLDLLQLRERVLLNALDLPERGEQHLAGIGERQRRLALKEREAAFALQRFEIPAETLMRDKELLGGLRDVQRFG